MTNIVFLDSHTLNPGDLPLDKFNTLGTFTAYDRTSPDKIIERSIDADIVIVNKVKLNASHFSQLPKLQLVCVSATGYDNVNIDDARQYGITVCNVAGYSTFSVAQMIMALLLEATNKVGQYKMLNQTGRWSSCSDFCYWESPLVELYGKSVGIVGFGNIGKCFSEMIRPFGVKLYAVTSKSSEELPNDITPISLKEAFRTLDVISLNCPLTEKNKYFVNKDLLSQSKKGLILINTARGLLVNDNDVRSALENGQLGAYCADVLSQEPPTPTHPLLNAPNCYLTPHIAWATVAARKRIVNILVENIRLFLLGKPQNIIC